jgi:hypothetical protein
VTDTVDADDTPPARDMLHAPTPNPSRLSTSVRYDLARGAEVAIHAYDVAGREVATIVPAAWRPPGRYTVPWDGADESGRSLAAGTYFVRLKVNGRPVGRARAIQRLR